MRPADRGRARVSTRRSGGRRRARSARGVARARPAPFPSSSQLGDGGLEEAAEAARRAIPVFERSDDALGLCRARRLEAWLHWNRARREAAAAAWERAAEHARRAGNRHEHDEILSWIASSLWFGPTPTDEGIRRCEQMRDQFGRAPRPRRRSCGTSRVSMPWSAVSHAARDLLATSNATYADLGLSLNAATSQNEAGRRTVAGQPGRGRGEPRVGYRALEAMGERTFRSTTAAFLARALLEQGRDQAADEFAELSSELAASGDLLTQILWRCDAHGCSHGVAQIGKAEALAREAVSDRRTDRLPQLSGGRVPRLGGGAVRRPEVRRGANGRSRERCTSTSGRETLSPRPRPGFVWRIHPSVRCS